MQTTRKAFHSSVPGERVVDDVRRGVIAGVRLQRSARCVLALGRAVAAGVEVGIATVRSAIWKQSILMRTDRRHFCASDWEMGNRWSGVECRSARSTRACSAGWWEASATSCDTTAKAQHATERSWRRDNYEWVLTSSRTTSSPVRYAIILRMLATDRMVAMETVTRHSSSETSTVTTASWKRGKRLG